MQSSNGKNRIESNIIEFDTESNQVVFFLWRIAHHYLKQPVLIDLCYTGWLKK